jgi:hypothetical protein
VVLCYIVASQRMEMAQRMEMDPMILALLPGCRCDVVGRLEPTVDGYLSVKAMENRAAVKLVWNYRRNGVRVRRVVKIIDLRANPEWATLPGRLDELCVNDLRVICALP